MTNQAIDQPPNVRRRFLYRSTFTCAAALAVGAPPLAASPLPRKRVAGIVTIYRRDSHADVILGKILAGWKQDGGMGPDLELVSLYVDQFPADDLSRGLADKYGFKLCSTVNDALTLGGNRLAVDGVLSIGEHGDYPYNDKGQHLYPRRRFFQQITDTFERCGQVVPVFNDKHPGPQLEDALWMASRAKELRIPWMAGSSLTVGYRDPAVTVPWGATIDAAVAVGYSGLDVYGFHTLDFMQCILERRGGEGGQPFERGVRQVQCLPVSALQQLIEQGTIRRDVLDAALAASGTQRAAVLSQPPEDGAIFIIEYRDGLRVPALMLSDRARAISVAFKTSHGPLQATRAEERTEPRYPHFACLLKSIEQMMHSGKAAYPVERTVLSAGMLDRLLTSRQRGGSAIETPELAIEYQPVDFPFGDALVRGS